MRWPEVAGLDTPKFQKTVGGARVLAGPDAGDAGQPHLERICVRAPYLMGRTIHMMLQMNCSYDSSGPHTEQLICSCSSPQSASSSRYLCFSHTSLVDESAECLYPVTLHLQTEQISSRCSGFMLASKRSLVICGCGCAS